MADRSEHAPESRDAFPEPESKRRKRHKPEPEPENVVHLILEKGLLDEELSEFTPILAHQVKADPRKKPGGLANDLTKLHGFADLHDERAEGPQDDLLGTARIDTEPSDPKGPQGEKAAIRILSIYGQRKGGKPGGDRDSSAAREEYFKNGLKDIKRQVPDLESIAFPEKIGCVIGGGDWGTYEKGLGILGEWHLGPRGFARSYGLGPCGPL
jgi:hypothetical protein